jgi:asparagine synthase (glutamine-hydrolysing)
VLYRDKMGFSIPLASWFRGPLRERVKQALLGPTLAGTGIFNMRFLQDMVEQHQSGRRDYTAPIYTGMMVEAFLRNCLEETPAHSLAAA